MNRATLLSLLPFPCSAQHFRDRWSTLKSVDEVMEAVVQKFADMGQLNNTYFFFSSDHG